MGRMAPNLAVQDAVVPRTRLAEILAGIAAIAQRHGVRVCNVFHAGDGNLHPNVPYDGRDVDEARRVHIAMKEIMSLCIAAGGTITGEHGVGLDKLGYMEQLFTPDTLDAMCRMRSAFDPDRRANPGKTIPVHSCREWHSRKFAAEYADTRQNTAEEAIDLPETVQKQGSVYSGATRIAGRVNGASRSGDRLFIGGSGSAVTPEAGVSTIDVRACNSVIEYVPEDLTITVGAGMTVAELASITAGNGQWCPLLPWGTDTATIGGVLASARHGPANAALGTPRDLTLGMTFVDGRASIVSSGGRVVKNVAGFDLTRALIGSWGTLGCIVSASLRLRALPAAQEAWIVPAAGVSRETIAVFSRGPYAPIACETVDGDFAAELKFAPEDHVVLWLAGSAVHVVAARSALLALAPAREVAMDVWRVIRARGPFGVRPEAEPMSAELRRLNARVRDVFDPHAVFVSPVVARHEELVHV